MRFSTFANELDNEPVVIDVPWDGLVENLADPEVARCTSRTCLGSSKCPHKKIMCWTPASWPDDVRRAKATVSDVSCFVCDIDSVTQERLDAFLADIAHLTHVVHSSHGDRPGKRKVRVVISLARTLAPPEHRRVWQWFDEAYPGDTGAKIPPLLDPSTKDASRLYFMPSRPSDLCDAASDGSGWYFYSQEGEDLDVDAILAEIPEQPEPAHRATVIPKFRGAPSEEGFEQAARILGQAWPADGRHLAHLALSGALARQGWPVELIGELGAAVAEVQESGNADLGKRLSAARSSVDKARSGDLTTGWPSVAEHVGDEAVHDACVALGIGVEGQAAQLGDFKERLAARMAAKRQEAAEASRQGDALVSRRLAERGAPANAPTSIDVQADLEIARDYLKKSRDPEKRRDGKLLGLVLRGQYLTENADERRRSLEQAAIVVARVARSGTTSLQVTQILLPCAGLLAQDLPDIVEFALGVADEAGPVVLPGSPVRATPEDLPVPSDDDEIRSQLSTTKEGDALAVGHNVERVIRYSSDTRELLRFNSLSKEVEVVGGRFSEEGVDGLPVGMKNWLGSHWGINSSTSEVSEQMMRIARTWCEYNPVAEYLESLEWDGVPRLGDPRVASWLTTYCKADDIPYNREIGSRFLIAAVARALDPGCKMDNVLILEGDQGLKKSMTFSILGGQWFCDTPIIIGDKDSRLMAACKWMLELAELKSLLRDEDSSKAFLSQRHDSFRPPYGRGTQDFLRCCVFGGSTNEHEYLPDKTGNRRYWAVRVGRCDATMLRRDRDQLWAEAVVRYRSASLNPHLGHPDCPGERWWFEPEEEAAADREIRSRRTDDPWVWLIKEWATSTLRSVGAQKPKQWFTMAEAALGALDMSPEGMRRNSRQIGAALREAGFDRVEVPGSEGADWVWVRAGTVLPVPQGVVKQQQIEVADQVAIN